MKHQRTRDYRRHVRTRAVAHAFDIYWHQFFYRDAFKPLSNRYYPVIIDNEQDRWNHEDEHRNEVFSHAKRDADNMRLCSCFMCSGYKKYEKTAYDLRELAREKDDLDELFGY